MKENKEVIEYIKQAIKQGTTIPVMACNLSEIFARQFNESVTPQKSRIRFKMGQDLRTNEYVPMSKVKKNPDRYSIIQMPKILPKRFKKVKSNKWEQPKMNGYLMKCCDCGLVHEMDFRIAYGKTEDKNRVQLRAKRLSLSTLQDNRIYKKSLSDKFHIKK